MPKAAGRSSNGSEKGDDSGYEADMEKKKKGAHKPKSGSFSDEKGKNDRNKNGKDPKDHKNWHSTDSASTD
ncbi:hypothetical protein DL766_005411 [Monosporascus sp. MC13-8B]|uniref:Uncharacterized protein n=1 Tax=Monosporascus cannonballus TaxID=155416 RepID=A0ABY0HIP2_9PEZI|nr:hypothetical protein DL763_007031 [Monosporascus cannonballus]RYO91474.1 hypothetical protein DL762_002200 [Monosporascus cannonballus]RYP29393.1 hypothetical protein DL766_005411 [Monosporascus sp. MC13-8B]